MVKVNNWDAEYDVVVLGFGGVGATAARFAADEGAKVLLVDAAPEGNEGGNTRYSAQMISASDDFEAEKKYFAALTDPMTLDQEIADTYVEGMANMAKYLKEHLGVEPYQYKRDYWNNPKFAALRKAIIDNTVEYPEFEGSEHHDILSVSLGFFDGALWKMLRQNVVDRSDKIDVWFSSPARHLIQDPATKTVIGVQIERDHVLRNIKANNGVVMATGGFENNPEMLEDYLGASKLVPLGTLYNKGDGIKMATEVGASLWHMNNYESLGMLHGLAFTVPTGKRGKLILGDWKAIYDGSVFLAGDDGTRYYPEDMTNRHGHVYSHGYWKVPQNNHHPHIIFDKKQYEKFADKETSIYPQALDMVIEANTLEELAKKIGAVPEKLQEQVAEFNFFATEGKDYAFHRNPETMQAFDAEGPYYALSVSQTVLNTQGGPRRNARAEILSNDGTPIPHLYGAGELGGISAGRYQAGENIAECLIFGKIAGLNAARVKEEVFEHTTEEPDAVSSASQTEKKVNLGSDLDVKETYMVGANQYLGRSNAGVGNEVVVRITVDDDKKLKDIEILKQSETGIGAQAIESMPKEMISKNTYDVDSISGASATSRALKEAVKDAMNKI